MGLYYRKYSELKGRSRLQRLDIALMLQLCFVWPKANTHQAILGFILYHQVYITRINRPNYVDLQALFSFWLGTVKSAYKNLVI